MARLRAPELHFRIHLSLPTADRRQCREHMPSRAKPPAEPASTPSTTHPVMLIQHDRLQSDVSGIYPKQPLPNLDNVVFPPTSLLRADLLCRPQLAVSPTRPSELRRRLEFRLALPADTHSQWGRCAVRPHFNSATYHGQPASPELLRQTLRGAPCPRRAPPGPSAGPPPAFMRPSTLVWLGTATPRPRISTCRSRLSGSLCLPRLVLGF